jgi:nucleotide-binding universal stress UspA family protein
MTVGTIFVALSGGSAGQGAVDLACRLARRFETHVEGFHVRADPTQAALGYGLGAPVVGDLLERTAQEIAESAERAKQHFDKAVAENDLPLKTEPPAQHPGAAVAPGASAAWREETGFAGDLIPRRARLFGLVVLGRSDRVVDKPHTDVLEDTVLRCGRPVLLAPASAPKHLGETIAIGWNGSSEAARAVAGAMPFLRQSNSVVVLTIGGGTGDADGQGLVQSLAWSGVAARLKELAPASGVSIGARLLSAARDEGADMLVMGGYGKAPWREMLLGGATRHVVATGLLPILICH